MLDVSDLIGVPFKVHGRDKKGLDCYGLLIEIAKRLGVTFPDAFYNSINNKAEVYNFLYEKLPVEKIDKLEKYCIILMLRGNNFSHVGIYLGSGKFIHATEDAGVCVQNIRRFEHKIKGLYRITGVVNGFN